MSPEYLSLFSKSSIPYSLRDNNKLIQQKMRTTTFGIKSFSYYGAHLWNSLPVDKKSAVTLGNFETLVKNWQGPSCHCSVCQLIIWIRIFTVVVLIFITFFMLFFCILSISRGYLTPKIRNTPTIHPRYGVSFEGLSSDYSWLSFLCVLFDVVLYMTTISKVYSFNFNDIHVSNICFNDACLHTLSTVISIEVNCVKYIHIYFFFTQNRGLSWGRLCRCSWHRGLS